VKKTKLDQFLRILIEKWDLKMEIIIISLDPVNRFSKLKKS